MIWNEEFPKVREFVDLGRGVCLKLGFGVGFIVKG